MIKEKYNLPSGFFLFVGAITKRKNLITVCKAMAAIKDKLDIPLVVLGNGKTEKEEAKQFMSQNGIGKRIIILNEMPQAQQTAFITAADFPAIYQQASALVYPSIFEGFGIPLLEALASGIPLISSNSSCLPEVGGDAALYFEPYNEQQLSEHMLNVATDSKLSNGLREKGFQQLSLFSEKDYAESVMQVYNKIA